MEQLQKIKNLLGMALVCSIVLLYSSCYTDLTYGTRGHGRINTDTYSPYHNKNLRTFSVPKHQKLKNGKHGRLYHEFMRPYKHNGKTTRQYLPKYRGN
jgi:hypothetical protein